MVIAPATVARTRHLQNSITIILSAKRGQSPAQPTVITRIPHGPILQGLNAAWTADHPRAPNLAAQSTDDDAMLLRLTDRSRLRPISQKIPAYPPRTGNDIDGYPKPCAASGLLTVYARGAAAKLVGVSHSDPRVADLIRIVKHGVVCAGGKGMIAGHGRADPHDRNGSVVLAATGVEDSDRNVQAPVETTQIALTSCARSSSTRRVESCPTRTHRSRNVLQLQMLDELASAGSSDLPFPKSWPGINVIESYRDVLVTRSA